MITSTRLPDNAKVTAAVLAGDGFLITRNGVPVAELRPVSAGRRRMIPRHEVRDLAAKGSRIDAAGSHRWRVSDLMIAATAHANGLALYTRKPGDFAGLGSRVRHLPESGYLAWQ
jgi:antitoxin (DNA-binding transcriptional repressor) of toxin-antitoxin stability system